MNVFEKYIANIKESEQLSQEISKLCAAHLMDVSGISERITGKRAVKFLSWEFHDKDSYYPKEVTINYIERDNDTGEEHETSTNVAWNNLLIKVDGYE